MPEPTRVLLLEDSEIDSYLIKAFLSRSGNPYVIAHATNATDFTTFLQATPAPEIVLSDLRLVDFDGLSALRQVRESGLNVPFIFVSGALPDDLGAILVGDGADDYLLKDRLGRLPHAIERALENRAAMRALAIRDAALAATENGIIIADANGADRPIIYVNPAVERLTGYAAAEMVGKNCRFLQRSDRDQPGLDTLRTALKEGTSAQIVLRNYRKDGTLFYNEFSLSPIRDAKGQVTQFVGLLNDVTERVKRDHALRESESRFRNTFDDASIGMGIVSIEGAFIEVNDALCRLVGYSESEMLSMTVIDLTYPDDRAETARILQRSRSGRISRYSVEKRYLHHDGSVLWILLNGTVVRDESGAALYHIGQIQDMTARKRLESQLVHSEKMIAMGELVSGIAHEINNPLAAISGHAQLLQSHPDHSIRADATEIRAMADRATSIVRSLLSFARRQNESIALEDADINAVVQASLTLLRATLSSNSVTIDVDLAEGLPPTAANTTQIEQVIVNLVTNAVHSLRCRQTDRRLRLTTALFIDSIGRDWITVELSDNGPGITESVEKRIFDPFFTTKDIGEGTGLGLSICHGIVQAHRGKIELLRSIPDTETTFRVTLPVGATLS
jgi:PAS domain S-box-containing protein